MAQQKDVDLSKYGEGYKNLIHILKHSMWFKNSHLNIARFLKTRNASEKQSIVHTLVMAKLLQEGVRASEVEKKTKEVAEPMSSIQDEQLAHYIFNIGYNQLPLLLRSYARYKVLSTGMKKAG
jgi:hypothetical protein